MNTNLLTKFKSDHFNEYSTLKNLSLLAISFNKLVALEDSFPVHFKYFRILCDF